MWAKTAFSAAAVMTIVGCAGGTVGTAARPVASVAAPATAVQTEVSNGLAGVASTYVLVAIDGHVLPYAPTLAGNPASSATQVISGTLTVEATGTFSMSTKYRAAEAQGERFFDGQFSGACAPDGERYRMYWDGGGETVLTSSGDTVTLNNGGVLFRYLRQH